MKSRFLKSNEIKKLKFKSIGKNCKISNKVSFIGEKNIKIGDDVRIDDYTILVAYDGSITIGSHTYIGGLNYISGSGNVKIGSFCDIAHGVKIYSKSDNYKLKKKQPYKEKVLISDNCIIGANTVILPGSKLNKNVRVGAMTLVNKEIKSGRLYFRNKTKKIK